MPRPRTGTVKVRPDGTAEAYAPPDPRGLNPKARPYLGVFATEKLARAAIDVAIAAMDDGEFVDPKAERTRLDDYWALWMLNPPRPLSGNTRALYEWAYKKHIRPKLGRRTLAQL